jgi:uncharacterized delta-60 repeat protein
VVLRYESNGSLDPSFGSHGVVVTDIATRDDVAHAIRLQADGKLIAGGRAGSNFALARYFSEGTLDDSFGTRGTVMTVVPSEAPYDMALQPDGKIVMLGSGVGGELHLDFALLRYENDTPIVYYDPVVRRLALSGTPFDDDLSLKVDPNGGIEILYQGHHVTPIDLSTGLPCVANGMCPTVANTQSIEVPLRDGDDRFALFGSDLLAIAGRFTGRWRSARVQETTCSRC